MRWFLAGLLEKELAKAVWEPFPCPAGLGLSPVPRGGEMRMCQKSQSL